MIVIVSICYGYNAARMIMPIITIGWYMVLFATRIYPTILQSFGKKTWFAIIYPYVISAFEAIGLRILDRKWNTLRRKSTLIHCCSCRDKCNWPWYCCCGNDHDLYVKGILCLCTVRYRSQITLLR